VVDVAAKLRTEDAKKVWKKVTYEKHSSGGEGWKGEGLAFDVFD
jgi:hypothetical protein